MKREFAKQTNNSSTKAISNNADIKLEVKSERVKNVLNN